MQVNQNNRRYKATRNIKTIGENKVELKKYNDTYPTIGVPLIYATQGEKMLGTIFEAEATCLFAKQGLESTWMRKF